MPDDIVKRLRYSADEDFDKDPALLRRAADEIERLRTVRRLLEVALADWERSYPDLTSPETPEDSPQSASEPPEAPPVPETGEGHTGRCGWRSDCTNPVTDHWLDVGSGLTYPLCTEHGNEATRRGWLRTVTP